MNKNVSKIYRWVSTVVLFPVTETPRWESVPLTISRTREPTVDSRMDIFWRVFHIFTLHLEISVGPEGLLNFLLLSTLIFFLNFDVAGPKNLNSTSQDLHFFKRASNFDGISTVSWLSFTHMNKCTCNDAYICVCIWLSLSLYIHKYTYSLSTYIWVVSTPR